MLRFATVLLCATCLLAPGQALAKGPLTEPDDGPDPRGVTVSGSGVALLKKPSHLSDATIARAVKVARPKAFARAVSQAGLRARELANAAGLTLGDARAVTERDQGAELGYQQTDHYCSATRTHGKRHLRCRFPVFTVATVTVTFATAETSAALSTGRVLVASGSATAPVTPVNPHSSPSIRRALLKARLAAAPLALADAQQDARSTAQAAGMELGAVFAIAEIRNPFDDLSVGSFGPGRYCGTIRRPIFRRDSATGRRRVVRTVSQRRCFFSREAFTAIRVTVLAR
jgi:hypothetical protein